ncbi:3-isopropylmalate dehydratase small subunit [Halanaeroarchaeum sp. HSR-CO]|uniref:3-isopropylmalate dehydratase small subunit n=1 Tax=Halanaeroarchaeum sp. HSR-CO TaxID=2866382 RepID=UPI00217F0299|nr:3-isopropylmalate dehydratase small subunit [Halanaeroarchaeum sp. HSR-CO]UWG48750.1 3-isopropylmalate dehydratase small subunit [Halanaeroarchaeum sp. HSR-CO]
MSADATPDEPPAERIESVSGTGVPVRGNDVDTDQIIPARFMKVVTFEGLGQYAFFDQRFDDEGNSTDHPFNETQYKDASVLVVNSNFGSGSSREHAPQALQRWGIDAVVGESFAEIFAGNCLALGMPTVTADHETIETLQAWVEANPDQEITVDVADGTVTYGETTVDVTVSDAQQQALVEGVWDTTAVMRHNLEQVRETARSLPYVSEGEVPNR